MDILKDHPSSPYIILRSFALAIRRSNVPSIRIALIPHTPIRQLADIFILKIASSGDIDRDEPEIVSARVLGSTQCNGIVGVPTSELWDAADHEDVLSECGGGDLIE